MGEHIKSESAEVEIQNQEYEVENADAADSAQEAEPPAEQGVCIGRIWAENDYQTQMLAQNLQQ